MTNISRNICKFLQSEAGFYNLHSAMSLHEQKFSLKDWRILRRSFDNEVRFQVNSLTVIERASKFREIINKYYAERI